MIHQFLHSRSAELVFAIFTSRMRPSVGRCSVPFHKSVQITPVALELNPDQHSFQQLRQLFLVQHALVCVHERVCSSLGVHPAIPPREAQHTDGMGWVSLPVRNLLGEFSPPVHAGPAAPISSAHLGANSQSKQKLDRVRGGGVGSLLLQMFLVLHGAAANQF